MEYINNYEELKSHVGEILHFSYEQYGHTVAYMKKLTRVSDTYDDESKLDGFPMFGAPIYGTNVVVLSSRYLSNLPRLTSMLNRETMSNAYQHIRIPTKEEMKTYMNALRKYRVFGNK